MDGFNPNKFIKENDEYKSHSINKPDVVEEKPKRKRKSSSQVVTSTEKAVIAPANQSTEINFLQTDTPYSVAYKETNEQLDASIKELNILGSEVMGEFVNIKNSKTLKNKYNYINEMAQTVTGIINAKVSIIKEKNKTINDVNTMELRRMKELKLSTSEEDDNTRIMNMYDAFINTPIGNGMGMGNILGPSVADMTLVGGAPDLNRVAIGNDQVAWEQSLSPADNRMVLEAKGVIETVVFYDEATGNRWYEVLDKTTGQPVPNVEKPDNSYIYDLDINVRGGYAKDPNRNKTYNLIVVNGGDTGITDY